MASSRKVTLYCAYKLWGSAYGGGVSDVTVTGNSLADAVVKLCDYVIGLRYKLGLFVERYFDYEEIDMPDDMDAEDDLEELLPQLPDDVLVSGISDSDMYLNEDYQIFVLLNETTHKFYVGEEFNDDPYNTQIMDKDDWDALNDEYDDDKYDDDEYDDDEE